MKIAWALIFSCGILVSFAQTTKGIGLLAKSDTIQFIKQPLFLKSTYIRTITPLPYVFTSPYRYLDDLGFMCKWELKMDQKIKQPVRIRLGSVDYVNHLEGK